MRPSGVRLTARHDQRRRRRGILAPAIAAMVLTWPAVAPARPLPRAVLTALGDCPAGTVEHGWPHPSDVRRWTLGSTTLFIVRCETSGDDEYYAAVTQTGSVIQRQSFPVFEDGRLVPDMVDVEAGRKQRLGQLHWQPRGRRLVGEISGGCAARTEFRYRWAGRFVLSEQRTSTGCGAPSWRADYRER